MTITGFPFPDQVEDRFHGNDIGGGGNDRKRSGGNKEDCGNDKAKRGNNMREGENKFVLKCFK